LEGRIDGVMEKKNFSKFQFLKANEIRPEGWVKEHLLIDADGYLPAAEKICVDVRREPFFKRIWVGCGPEKSEEDKEFLGIPRFGEYIERCFNWWHGECCGWWIDAMVRLAYLTEREDLKRQVTQWMNKLIETQGEDGYIGLFPEGDPYRWTDGCSELWPQCHVYRAMLAYHDFTERPDIWTSLLRAATLTTEHFDNGKRWVTEGTDLHGMMMVEPMLELYSRTGDAKFLNFARNMVEYNIESNEYLRNMWKGELSGHGVHVIEHLRIPAMIYAYTGNSEYLKVSIDCCNIIHEEFLNSNGAPKSDELINGGAAPNKASEYCDITEWMITCSQMLAITGDVKFADWAEKDVFNAAMGARRPDGKGIQYFTLPNQVEASIGRYTYRPDHFPFCCNPQAGRLMPYFLGRSWMRTTDGNGIAAAFYLPCRVKTWIGKNKSEVTIREETNYPFDENVRFIIDTETPIQFDLLLRIPCWCDKPNVKINGEPFKDDLKPGSFARISRIWSQGDIVELHLPMHVKVEKDKFNLVSVTRGPLVYSLKIPADAIDFDRKPLGFSARAYVPFKGAKWKYALIIDEENPDNSFKVKKIHMPANVYPWEIPPVQLEVKAQEVPDWGTTKIKIEDDQMAPVSHMILEKIMKRKYWMNIKEVRKKEMSEEMMLCDIPKSPVNPSGKVLTLTLIPYGFTQLRITNFPYVKHFSQKVEDARDYL